MIIKESFDEIKEYSTHELVASVRTVSATQKVAAVLLYRVNKSIKYMQFEEPGLAKSFYRLKAMYIDYFIKEGFVVKPEEEKDMKVVSFDVYGALLRFHRIAKNTLNFETTVDISETNDEIARYSKEAKVMYKLLVKIAESLNINEASKHFYSSKPQ